MSAENDQPAPIRNPEDGEFNQREQAKRFWNARKDIDELHKELSLKMGASINQQQAEFTFHKELKHYLIITHTLYVNKYPDIGLEEWFQAEIGRQVIDPPPELTGQDEQFNGLIQTPASSETREFIGLKSLLDTPPVDEVKFNAIVHIRHRGADTETATKRVTVPWNILNGAWMVTEGFMDTIGMGVDTGGMVDSEPDDLI